MAAGECVASSGSRRAHSIDNRWWRKAELRVRLEVLGVANSEPVAVAGPGGVPGRLPVDPVRRRGRSLALRRASTRTPQEVSWPPLHGQHCIAVPLAAGGGVEAVRGMVVRHGPDGLPDTPTIAAASCLRGGG